MTLYPERSFRREDETDDPLFYAEPRLVVHIGEYAIRAIACYFGRVLPHDGVILDLMSSWRSHMPENLRINRLVGLGLNEVEMAENPQLHHAVVHDIGSQWEQHAAPVFVVAARKKARVNGFGEEARGPTTLSLSL